MIFTAKASAADRTSAIKYTIEVTEEGAFSKACSEFQQELTPVNFLWDPYLFGKCYWMLLV